MIANLLIHAANAVKCIFEGNNKIVQSSFTLEYLYSRFQPIASISNSLTCAVGKTYQSHGERGIYHLFPHSTRVPRLLWPRENNYMAGAKRNYNF